MREIVVKVKLTQMGTCIVLLVAVTNCTTGKLADQSYKLLYDTTAGDRTLERILSYN